MRCQPEHGYGGQFLLTIHKSRASLGRLSCRGSHESSPPLAPRLSSFLSFFCLSLFGVSFETSRLVGTHEELDIHGMVDVVKNYEWRGLSEQMALRRMKAFLRFCLHAMVAPFCFPKQQIVSVFLSNNTQKDDDSYALFPYWFWVLSLPNIHAQTQSITMKNDGECQFFFLSLLKRSLNIVLFLSLTWNAWHKQH